MADSAVAYAQSVQSTNPQYLIDIMIRNRIYVSHYWKAECCGLSAELLVEKAKELEFVGGVHGDDSKPAPFLCLLLKMLQLQPKMCLIVEFIRQGHYKYARTLCALYMRLVGTSLDCHKYLVPLYDDHRKIRRQNRTAAFEVLHVDGFINELFHSESVCDVVLPVIQNIQVLEENSETDSQISDLEESEWEYDDITDTTGRIHNSHSRIEESSRNVSPAKRGRSSHKKSHSSRRHSRDHSRNHHRRHGRSRRRNKVKRRHRSHKDRKYRSRFRSVKNRDRKSRRHRSHERSRNC